MGSLRSGTQRLRGWSSRAHTDSRRIIGLGLIVQSELSHARGDLDDAEALAQEGLAVWREVGGQTNFATMLALLGTLQYERGNLPASEALLQESRALSERLSDTFNLGDIWTRLGHLARLQGRWDQAVAAYQRSLQVQAADRLSGGSARSARGTRQRVVGAGGEEQSAPRTPTRLPRRCEHAHRRRSRSLQRAVGRGASEEFESQPQRCPAVEGVRRCGGGAVDSRLSGEDGRVCATAVAPFGATRPSGVLYRLAWHCGANPVPS